VDNFPAHIYRVPYLTRHHPISVQFIVIIIRLEIRYRKLYSMQLRVVTCELCYEAIALWQSAVLYLITLVFVYLILCLETQNTYGFFSVCVDPLSNIKQTAL